jgi:hypothetical protein
MTTCKSCCFIIASGTDHKCLLTMKYTAPEAKACKEYDKSNEPYTGYYRDLAGMKAILGMLA